MPGMNYVAPTSAPRNSNFIPSVTATGTVAGATYLLRVKEDSASARLQNFTDKQFTGTGGDVTISDWVGATVKSSAPLGTCQTRIEWFEDGEPLGPSYWKDTDITL
ncbi:MAG: hypothetical protein HYR85_17160 [Planctomycetes bacterium]|nr:hypothetical protein [Planctomycetota bacterium]MBI3845370.1 hypothetical protein [Planctomycetota bacterium]